MSRFDPGGKHGGRARPRRAAAILAGTCVLAIGGLPLASAPPASARFFDVGRDNTIVLHPLPASFSCAMEAALAGRHASCR